MDAGTAATSGKLLIRDASDVLLGTLTFSNPSFGTASAGRITPNAITAESNAPATGTASKFQVINRDATIVFSGTITATGGGGDLTMSRVTVNAGDTISAVSFLYDAPL